MISPGSSHACTVQFADCCEKLCYFWSCESNVSNILAFKIFLWDQTVHDGPWGSNAMIAPVAAQSHESQQLLGTCQMDQMFQHWICLLKADTDSGVGKYQTKKKLLKPEILSLLQQRTLSSPAGQWQLLVLAVILCHPELVPELPLCSLHWVFSLLAMVHEHLSCFCWMFATSLLFLSSPC